MRDTSHARRASAALLPACMLTACTPAVLDPAGPVSRAQNAVLFDAIAIMLTIVVPTILAALAFAWWFRKSNHRAKYRPDWAFSGQIELVVWSVPLLTIMFLSGLIWVSSHQLDPAEPLSGSPPLDVQVVSLDWKWLFIYPEQGVASVNTVVVPAGRPVRFRLTSASVMNAFFVPRLGSMIYTMNGMQTTLNLMADQPGVFPGLSSHYSGDGFSGMRFDLHAVPQPAFERWVAATRARPGPALDALAYASLARQSSDVAPFTYPRAQPGLFEAVVRQQIAPAAGPSKQQPSQHVHPL